MGATNVPAENICKTNSFIVKVHVLNNLKVFFMKFIDTRLKILSQKKLEVYVLSACQFDFCLAAPLPDATLYNL